MQPATGSDTIESTSLQAAWWRGRMWLWAAQSGDAGEGAPASEGDAVAARVAGEFNLEGSAARGQLSRLTLWRPASGKVPVAAAATPPSIAPTATTAPATAVATLTAADRGAVGLVAREVAAVGYGPAEAVELLVQRRRAAAGGGGDGRGPSDSIEYWALLSRYAVDLLARQRFMPSLARAERGFTARWLPAICDDAELSWVERVAAAMPPVCRAFVTDDAAARDAVRLVESFLEAAVDDLVRRFLSQDEFFVELPARARREPHWDLQFLSGLIMPERQVAGDAELLGEIADKLEAWTAPLREAVDESPPRLAMRFEEPDLDPGADNGDGDADGRDGDNGDSVGESAAVDESQTRASWRLHLMLRASDDQAPLDIAAIWRAASMGQSALRSRAARRRDELRGQLKRAASLFSPLRRAQAQEAPRVLTLSVAEAHQFLREGADRLADDGFEVELPDWARRPDRSIGLCLDLAAVGALVGDLPESDSQRTGASPSATGGAADGSLGLGALVEFNWRIALGDERLTAEEFERLAARKAPLVRLRDRWIGIDADEARRALAFVRANRGGRMTLAQALRLAGGAEESAIGLPIVGLTGRDWLGRLLADTPEAQMEIPPQPSGFVGELRPYQLRGLAWLSFLDRLGIGSCLADDMGLGKTIELIALLLHERQSAGPAGRSGVDGVGGGGSGNNGGVGPTLLFAPMSVVGNWEREIARFAPGLRVLVHHGALRLSGDAFLAQARQSDVVITTYGLAGREQESFGRVAWHRVAMDEAQKIKNPTAAQTVALKSIPSPRRVALTGTPLENHLTELWSIMDALNPGLMGTASAFRSRYATPIERGGDAARAEQLRRFIRPFILRRLKNDPTVACDLPEKMEMSVFCNLTPEQAALYEQVVADMLRQVDRATGIRRRGLILATLTRLKQVCNHPAQFLKADGPLDRRSGKCERLVEMLEEVIDEGDAALVFTQYREMGHLLERMLIQRLGIEVLFLHGGTPIQRRNELVDRFQSGDERARVFLLSLRAGGFGLNLARANHVFHFDRWWNPAVEEQATDRAHRIGQTRHVQVHKFVCIGTVEERIDRLLAQKTALAETIVGSGDDWLTGLSTVELQQYLALGDDAVAEED